MGAKSPSALSSTRPSKDPPLLDGAMRSLIPVAIVGGATSLVLLSPRTMDRTDRGGPLVPQRQKKGIGGSRSGGAIPLEPEDRWSTGVRFRSIFI